MTHRNPIAYYLALQSVLSGCFPENEHVTGACPEYTRGVLNTLAEVFAVPDVPTSERMDQILGALTYLATGDVSVLPHYTKGGNP